jgi:hypothetical protein
MSGDFVPLFFTDTIMANSYTDRSVVKSLIYRYIYRARNINGWGDFSEPGYLFAANVPGKSSAPERISFNKTTLVLRVFAP